MTTYQMVKLLLGTVVRDQRKSPTIVTIVIVRRRLLVQQLRNNAITLRGTMHAGNAQCDFISLVSHVALTAVTKELAMQTEDDINGR